MAAPADVLVNPCTRTAACRSPEIYAERAADTLLGGDAYVTKFFLPNELVSRASQGLWTRGLSSASGAANEGRGMRDYNGLELRDAEPNRAGCLSVRSRPTATNDDLELWERA